MSCLTEVTATDNWWVAAAALAVVRWAAGYQPAGALFRRPTFNQAGIQMSCSLLPQRGPRLQARLLHMSPLNGCISRRVLNAQWAARGLPLCWESYKGCGWRAESVGWGPCQWKVAVEVGVEVVGGALLYVAPQPRPLTRPPSPSPVSAFNESIGHCWHSTKQEKGWRWEGRLDAALDQLDTLTLTSSYKPQPFDSARHDELWTFIGQIHSIVYQM